MKYTWTARVHIEHNKEGPQKRTTNERSAFRKDALSLVDGFQQFLDVCLQFNLPHQFRRKIQKFENYVLRRKSMAVLRSATELYMENFGQFKKNSNLCQLFKRFNNHNSIPS